LNVQGAIKSIPLLSISCALALCLPGLAGAQSKRPLIATKTESPPVIDGDITDAAWQAAPKADGFVEFITGSSPAAAEQTTAWVLYDAKFIYAAFYCRDSDPASITARETVRDSKYQGQVQPTENEDNVEFVLDPFQAHRAEDLTKFSVNAIGTRSARIGGGRADKSEWKGDWDAAVKRVADGWTVEMRIPWQILNFPGGSKPVNMGINFFRFQHRTHTWTSWSDIGPNVFHDLEGLWTGVQAPASAFKPHLSLLPYIAPSVSDTTAGFRAGLDARYAITPELTAVGSVNPDFGTIEGAVASIQFQHGERLLEERRPFFLEGADYINSPRNSTGMFFYSRRIRDFDVGTKLYGKLSPVDSIGILNTEDFGNRNDLVARYRHDLGPTTAVNAMFVNANNRHGNNSVAVLRPEGRWGKLGVIGDIAQSSAPGQTGWNKQAFFTYGDKFLYWSVRFFEIGDDFRDDDGFIPFTGIKGARPGVLWGAEYKNGPWRSLYFSVNPQFTYHSDGTPFEQGGSTELIMDTRTDWEFDLGFTDSKFDGAKDKTIYFAATQNISNRFHRWSLTTITGTQADEPYTFVGPTLTTRILKKLDLGYSGAFQNFEGHDQQHILTAGYDLSPTRSFGARMVVNNADTNWYLSFRNSGEKGTETYIILGDPNASRFKKRLTVKFVFAL
jgi:hypothetical protein